MVWLYVGTLTKVLVREKDICLCLQNKARMTNQIFGKTRLCVDLISSNFIMQTVGQVARWSIAAAQVLGWQPFLGTTKVPHGMIPDSAISVKSLAHKYIIWRSPRGFLNNRIDWINGFVLRVGKRVGTSWHHVPCNLLFTNQGFGWWAQMWSEGLEPQGRIAQSIHAAWVQSPRFFSYTTLKQLFTCFQNRVAFQVASQLSPHSLSWHSCGRHTAIGDEVVSSLGNRTIVIVSWAVAPSLITISGFSWFSHVSCSQVSALWLRALPPGHHAPPADLLTSSDIYIWWVW